MRMTTYSPIGLWIPSFVNPTLTLTLDFKWIIYRDDGSFIIGDRPDFNKVDDEEY